MILAHHMGEDLWPALISTATVSVPAFVAVGRAKLSRIRKTTRRRRTPPEE